MIDLVTVTAAKAQVHEVLTVHDADIAQKITQASAIVLNYIEKEAIPAEWILDSSPLTYEIPELIQAATLIVFGELYANREAGNANPLSDYVKNLLHRYRDPSFA